MMKCVNCGFEIPDGGAFCPGCGIRLGVKSINTKTKARIWPAVIIALFVAAIILTVSYFSGYINAKNAAESGDFEQAMQYLKAPGITARHDPELISRISSFLDAKNTLESGDIYGAFTQYRALENQGYNQASKLLEENKVKFYDHAVSMYRKDRLNEAKTIFIYYPKYKNSSKYLTMINGKTSSYGIPSFSQLTDLIGFEDTAELIAYYYPCNFLEGKWVSDDRKNLTIKATSSGNSWTVYTSLPLRDGSLLFDKGRLYSTNDNTMNPQYDLIILSKDRIQMNNLKSGDTYYLTRNE